MDVEATSVVECSPDGSQRIIPVPAGAEVSLGADGHVQVNLKERSTDQLALRQLVSCDFEVRKPKDATDDDHVLEFIGSTSARDSYGDRIAVKGWELKRFKKNPVFMPSHNYSKMPIGKALKVMKDAAADALRFIIKFATDLPGAPGEEALNWYNAYKAKYVKGSSVGFMPLEWKVPQNDEEREELGLGRFGVYFTKAELLELSAVSIPSNPEAVVQLSLGGIQDIRSLIREETINVVEELLRTVDEVEDEDLDHEDSESRTAGDTSPEAEADATGVAPQETKASIDVSLLRSLADDVSTTAKQFSGTVSEDDATA